MSGKDPSGWFLLFSGIVVLLISCSGVHRGEGGLIENGGSERLKLVSTVQPDIFIGVSKEQPSLAQAREDALRDAREQIVESLGLEIQIDHRESLTQNGSGSVMKPAVVSERMTRYRAGGFLDVRENDLYWEKREVTGTDSVAFCYRAWVQVPFSAERYKQTRLAWLRTITGRMNDLVRQTPVDASQIKGLQEATESFHASDQEVSVHTWMRGTQEYGAYTEARARFAGLLSEYRSRLRISSGLENVLPPARCSLRVIFDSEPLVHQRIYLTGIHGLNIPEMVTTNGEGILQLRLVFVEPGQGKTPDHVSLVHVDQNGYPLHGEFTPELFLFLGEGPNTRKQRVIRIPSPFDPGWIPVECRFEVNPSDAAFKGLIMEGLRKSGMRTSADSSGSAPHYVVRCEMKADVITGEMVQAKLFSARSSIKLAVFHSADERHIMEYQLPNERFPDTRGFGRTGYEARISALRLENMPGKERLAEEISNRIVDVIKGDVVSRYHSSLMRSQD